ncbi:MAG TPA: hypothetical protein VGR03_17980 [Candidatus Acidoferrum sp.]|nr:hypothetical protein [Candidatus Acidoferrum sp.]
MRLILHILKKDMRRHWPEILISLVLLGLYVWVTLQGPNNRFVGARFLWFQLSVESIPPLMIFFWIFLTVRVVQGETLVGDRQWWVTKPYEWWTLLAAKELFLVVCFGVPLFFVQLYLMHHAGFPVFRNLLGILTMQFELGFVLFMPSVALGSLAKGLGQALVGIIVVIIGFWATSTLLEKVPSSGMSSAVRSSDDITGMMVLASIIGAVIWQYARRRTWAARGLLVGGMGAVALISALTPYARFVDRKYPLVKASEAPAHFAVAQAKPSPKKQKDPLDFTSDVYLRIPLLVSGIDEGRVVELDGIEISVETSSGAKWDPGWKSQWVQFWKEDDIKSILYDVKRKAYERVKKENARLHIELALTEYQAGEVRELVLKDGEFSEPQLGICSLNEKLSWQIDCRRPFQTPGLMATFDPSAAKCGADEDTEDLPEDRVSHAWFAPHSDNSPDAGFNPVDKYQITLGSRRPFYTSGEKRKFKAVHLCTGARVNLAEPQEKRHVRVKLDMDNVRLQDLLETGFDWD